MIPFIIGFALSAVVCAFAFPPDQYPLMYALCVTLMGWLIVTGDSGEP